MSVDQAQMDREAAVKWVMEDWSEEELDEITNRWLHSNTEIALAYMAGLRAERARNRVLREEAEVAQLRAEVASLREAVRDIDSFIGTSGETQLREWHRWEKLPAVLRALAKNPVVADTAVSA